MKSESINELKEKLKIDHFLKNYTFDDDICSVYLQCYNNDVDKVINHLYKLADCAKRNGHLMHCLPTNYREVYGKRIHRILKSKNVNNGGIIVIKVGNWNTDEISFEELMASSLIAFHSHLFRDCDLQKNQTESIFDCRGIGIRHILSLSYKVLLSSAQIMNLYQPDVVVKSHIVYENRLFHYGYNLAKPFMDKKAIESLHLHGNDLTDLYNHFPSSSLPEDLGGTLVDDYTDDDYEKIILQEYPRLAKFFKQFATNKPEEMP